MRLPASHRREGDAGFAADPNAINVMSPHTGRASSSPSGTAPRRTGSPARKARTPPSFFSAAAAAAAAATAATAATAAAVLDHRPLDRRQSLRPLARAQAGGEWATEPSLRCVASTDHGGGEGERDQSPLFLYLWSFFFVRERAVVPDRPSKILLVQVGTLSSSHPSLCCFSSERAQCRARVFCGKILLLMGRWGSCR